MKQCSFLNDKCLLLNLEQGAILCTKCHSLLQKAQVPKVCTSYNKLKTGYVPLELSNMFVIEKRIIAQIPVFLTLIILPGGQSAQKGTAINTPIDITEQISLLTQTHQPGTILISCERPNDNPVVLPLRQSVLYRAFSWLKSNNHFYKDINITHLLPLSAGILYDNDDDTIQEEYGLIGKDSMSYQGNYNNVDTPACTLPVACGQPVTLSSIPFGEEKAFPWLFPNGINGISTNRPLPLTTLDYYQSRLYNHDSRWRCDIPYIMSALNNHEWELLTSLVSTYMRTKKLCAGTGSFLPVTAPDVNNARNDPILMQNTYMFTKDIRGTAACWKSVLMKLLAMVRSLGPPTFFLTLSANDNWPETKAMLKLHKQHFYNNIDTVQGDPLMASLAFQQRWSVLLKEILKKEAPLGKINEFFVRVEFQARGAPHLHIFLWTETGISLETATSNEIISLLDKTICTQLPDENKDKDLHRLVHTLQVHKHSFTCRKGVRLCRFNFPKPVCKQTKLCYNPDTILHRHGKFYETQRFFTDTWVNAYNPIILRHWRANMDIQLVGNAESCAFYVCKYICKAEPEELKEALHALFTNTEFTTIDMRKRLLKIGACVLKKRRISAQEAVYRLGSMKLYQSSKQVITLNTLPPHRRMKLIKPKAQRDHLPLNCTDENLIFESNILDYYRKRPSNLSVICLHDFASWYTRDSGPQRPSAKLPRYKLQSPYNNIVFRRRQHNVIIKPSHVKQTTDDYYYSCLLLYLPHTTENQLLIPFPSYKASFYNHFQDLDSSYKRCVVIASELEAAVRRIRLSQIQLNMSYTEQNPENVALATDANDYAVYDIPNSGNPNTSVMMNCDIPSNASDDFCWHTLSTCSLSETELETNIAKLTADQKNVMQVVQSHFSNPDTQTRLRIFCTGGAGAGKSFLLKTIVEWIRLCYPFQPGHDPVIVTAPSGVAARNVLGLTIHSVFRLPVQHGYEPEYHDLSSFALKKLQDVFRNVHTIIVDEISMVSCKYFHYIHQRLCSIKNCGEPFGGLNVILFGDFYQLRPVCGHFFFTDQILWPLFTPFFLTSNKRQAGNNTFIELLNRVRLGQPSPANISLLSTRLIVPDKKNISSILHIFPTRAEAKSHNEDMQTLIQSEAHIFHADHIYSQFDVHPGHAVSNSHIPDDDRDAGGLLNTLQVSVGTRVMLLRNLCTKEGLVNGAIGLVTHVNSTNSGNIHVKFDNCTIGKRFQSSHYSNAIPITQYTQEYLYQGRFINRIQFPLVTCWATTVHKIQGVSLDSAVVCLSKKIFQAGQAYVALSRVRSLNGLYLRVLCPQSIYANEAVIEEYNRLYNIK